MLSTNYMQNLWETTFDFPGFGGYGTQNPFAYFRNAYKHQSFDYAVHESKGNFEILGLAEDATVDQIRSTYKKLCLLYHPDRHSIQNLGETDEEYEARQELNANLFKNILTAYEKLIESKK